MEESRAKQRVEATKGKMGSLAFLLCFPISLFCSFCVISGRLRSLLPPSPFQSLSPPPPFSPAVPSFIPMPGRNGEIKGISRTRSPQ